MSSNNNGLHTPSRITIINPSLMKLKLLEVLRNNDTVKLLELINQIDENSSNFDLFKLKNEILLFAVQVGSLSIIKFIVEKNLIDDINIQDNDGNTALHLAAISNRNDIIEYLLNLSNINDCIYNKDLKQPIQCTNNIETAQLMDYLRSKYIEKIASELRNSFENRNFELLDKLLTNSRDKELLDINGTDPITSETVLIEFVKKNDYEMVKFILDHGGDPFKRSLSGKLPEELTNDIDMKKIIEDSFNKQNIIDSTSHNQDGSPTLKGFLKKWTNFAGGYKLRWFVLDNQARLSYYKSPNDMNNTCRGMIHLAHAMLKVDSSENIKFEIIIQNPSDGSPVRWHLRANHSTEAQKWIWVLQNAITFAKDYEKKQRRSIMLSHILSEDLPLDNHINIVHNNNNNNNNSISTSSSLKNNFPIILESEVLNNENENEKRRPVSSIISDANDASNELKELIKVTDSDTNLPLKINSNKLPEIEINNINKNNNDDNNDNDYNDDNNNNNNDNNNNNNNDQSTNISYDENSNSLRNHITAVPDRASQYSGKSFHYDHGRAASFSSFNSTQSNGSIPSSKNSLAKKIYKKPLKKLSKLGKKTRDSFIVDYNKDNKNLHSNNSSKMDNSYQSSISNASSIISSPDINNNNNNNYDNDDNDDDDDDESDIDYVPNSNINNKIKPTTDLNVVRNQITIQLKTFKDFLESAVNDDSITKDDLVGMSTGILSTLDILINEEGTCVNHKYNELIRRLEKQQKISSIWENSIKQLELEIREREGKIVELEDKLKAVKKSLRNSVSHLHNNKIEIHNEEELSNLNPTSNSVAALTRQALTANLNKNKNIPPVPTSEPPFDLIKQQKEEEESALKFQQQKEKQNQKQNNLNEVDQIKAPSHSPPPVPFDSTLTEFLEETDDSDDEFFDAEDVDEVKDMSVLTRRETLKALKEKKSKLTEVSNNENQENSVDKLKTVIPPVPQQLPPPIPQTKKYEEPKLIENNESQVQQNDNYTVNKSIYQDELSLQPSEATTIANENDESKAERKLNFKPKTDEHGHFIVNGHELLSETQNKRYNEILKDESFEGYEDPLRLSLAPEDNRPKISLWGVLKSLIGKDMTKMTLPVSFNEPTSLLQRNVEVIEYSELLDKAAAIDSSTLRLVYVATFAASEYASTVGRIAKPFNPLLGETFEYSRSDKGYRCFVEQVSHHPPISALIAESPTWSYYGESDVQTKFLGRSFDIKHLGTWYCEVFPDSGVECKDGQKTDRETYSWRKVNNSVIGIMMGNPTIDNYGDMEIHNHMTGDYMKFTFKPRGWRASSAYEVKGEVFNAKGKLIYYVGGHWNSKIFCKPADDKNAERFLVWEAAPRKEMMFHLTNFAATLNAPQPHLLPKIACTDTRLRPDQRAMEDGDYDLAASEKNRVEDKQRKARRQREMKGETYKPTFFVKDKHPVTGESFWKYRGTYWEERKEGKLKNYKDIF